MRPRGGPCLSIPRILCVRCWSNIVFFLLHFCWVWNKVFLLHVLNERWSVLIYELNEKWLLDINMREDSDSWVRSKCTWYCHFKSVPDKALSCALQLCVQCCREDIEPRSCTKRSKQFLIRTNPPAIVQLGIPPIRVLVLRVLNKTAWKNLPHSYLYSRLRLEVEVLGAGKALQFDNVLKTTLKASGHWSWSFSAGLTSLAGSEKLTFLGIRMKGRKTRFLWGIHNHTCLMASLTSFWNTWM